mmetsp:Transcript_31204/g.101762  ORF Transcript_31204/g.101762 Transcript_31204/m.101762 type:complete len:213 (-) Transcript_31204:671-1309(-)
MSVLHSSFSRAMCMRELRASRQMRSVDSSWMYSTRGSIPPARWMAMSHSVLPMQSEVMVITTTSVTGDLGPRVIRSTTNGMHPDRQHSILLSTSWSTTVYVRCATAFVKCPRWAPPSRNARMMRKPSPTRNEVRFFSCLTQQFPTTCKERSAMRFPGPSTISFSRTLIPFALATASAAARHATVQLRKALRTFSTSTSPYINSCVSSFSCCS